MKVISNRDLIKLLLIHGIDKGNDQHSIARIFETYGDDYFTEMGQWNFELCKENEERKELFRKLDTHEETIKRIDDFFKKIEEEGI